MTDGEPAFKSPVALWMFIGLILFIVIALADIATTASKWESVVGLLGIIFITIVLILIVLYTASYLPRPLRWVIE